MVKKIIKSPKGFSIRDIKTNPTGTKKLTVIFRKNSKLGKLLKTKKTKVVRIPKGMALSSFSNNSPRVGSGKLIFRKRR